MPAISRRKMLLGAAAMLAFPAACATAKDRADCDLIVVGTGFAGLIAACHAAEAGLSVMVLEKEPVLGGSSMLSRGSTLLAGTTLQAESNFPDSPEALTSDILKDSPGLDPDLIGAMSRSALSQYEWFERKGVRPTGIFSEHGSLRVHHYDVRALKKALLSTARENKVRILTNARADKLLTENQRVVGVEFVRAGKRSEAFSSRGVVLATGGFSRNKTMLARFSADLAKASTIAAQGNDGDGHRMAEELGAGIVGAQYIETSYAFPKKPSLIDDKTVIQYFGAVIVNRKGQRFVDESLSYRSVARKVMEQKGAESFLVFDERIRQTALEQESDKRYWREISGGNTTDSVYAGRTLEEAAEKAQVSPVALRREIDAYNHAVNVRDKESIRRGPLFDGSSPVAINTPPYYIMPAYPCLVGTYAGLAVNGNAQVLRGGKPIEGLWAAGEVAGGMHGEGAYMGAPLASAFAFGRIAGLHAAGRL